ncbi:hypothetical protein DSM112329_01702 [Paraconexibacter sp. AEG42_29]|uniref:Uncharacterized protein n=1 Tax=Paraconexibacter sp. AEG42_29 TaxID=2997339 RepID=A0AAU7ATB8_9ACTN
MTAASRHLIVATPIGPLTLDLTPGARPDEYTVSARGRLVPPSGALDSLLLDLATVDLASGTVATDRRRLRRSLRLAHGPRTAMRLIPILMPPLERILAQDAAILAYAELHLRLAEPLVEAPPELADAEGMVTAPSLVGPPVTPTTAPVLVRAVRFEPDEELDWQAERRPPVDDWRGPVAHSEDELLSLAPYARPLARAVSEYA